MTRSAPGTGVRARELLQVRGRIEQNPHLKGVLFGKVDDRIRLMTDAVGAVDEERRR